MMASESDSELLCMAAIVDNLVPLDGAACARVLRWAADRYAEQATERPLTPSAVFHSDGHECDASLVLGAINASLDEALDHGYISTAAHRGIIRRAQEAVAAERSHSPVSRPTVELTNQQIVPRATPAVGDHDKPPAVVIYSA